MDTWALLRRQSFIHMQSWLKGEHVTHRGTDLDLLL